VNTMYFCTERAEPPRKA